MSWVREKAVGHVLDRLEPHPALFRGVATEIYSDPVQPGRERAFARDLDDVEISLVKTIREDNRTTFENGGGI